MFLVYNYFKRFERGLMKKALLLVSILFVSVFSTACINNFAVQELNSKAKVYLEEGDYNLAIERLKSSIDLDDSIFETHYNLAVAYTQAEDYLNAIEEFKVAAKLNSEVPDVFYSLAIAQENLAHDLIRGTIRISENNELYKPQLENQDEDSFVADEKVVSYADNLKDEAVANYKLYLDKAPDSSDAQEVNQRIKTLMNNDSESVMAE